MKPKLLLGQVFVNVKLQRKKDSITICLRGSTKYTVVIILKVYPMHREI